MFIRLASLLFAAGMLAGALPFLTRAGVAHASPLILHHRDDDSAPLPNNNNNTNAKLPLDLFLLIDSSGSIGDSAANAICKAKTKDQYPGTGGLTCWQLIVNFVDALQEKMASLAGGYDTDLTGGLRMSIYTFSCRNGKPITKTFLSGPSGEESAVADALTQLRKVKPNLGTCPSQGMQRISTEIKNSIRNNVTRPRAVIFVTDGLVEDSNVKASTSAAKTLRGLNSTTMLGVALGKGGKSAANEIVGFLGGDASRLFPAADAAALDDLSNLLAALMLGRVEAEFAPTPIQLQEVIPFLPHPNNGSGGSLPTVCAGASPPIAISGRTVELLGPGILACDISDPFSKIPARTVFSQSFTPSTLNTTALVVYCNVSGYISPGVTEQTVILKLVAVSGGQKRALGYAVNVTLGVAPCVSLSFAQGNSSDAVGGDTCFPPPDPSNTTTGRLIIEGPTVAYAESLPLTGSPAPLFRCRFENTPFVTAARERQGRWYCDSPPVDYFSALNEGKSPGLFTNFTVVYGSNTIAPIASSSTSNNGGFKPPICATPLIDNALLNATWCWTRTSPATSASWSGLSLSRLASQVVAAGIALEYSCVFTNSYGDSVSVNATSATPLVVQCDVPPASLFLKYRPLTTAVESDALYVSLRVRSRLDSPAGDSRGWWVLLTDQPLFFSTSACLSSHRGTSDPLCLGHPTPLTLSGVGVSNILGDPQYAALGPLTCRHYYFDGKTTSWLATSPLELVDDDDTSSAGLEAGCVAPASPFPLRRVEIWAGNNTHVMSDEAYATDFNNTLCLAMGFLEDKVRACWGPSSVGESTPPLVVLTGVSLPLLYNLSAFPGASQCEFTVMGATTRVFHSVLGVVTSFNATCPLPSAVASDLFPPFSGNVTVRVVKGGIPLLNSPTGNFALALDACMALEPRAPPGADENAEVSPTLSAVLPSCFPNCCLRLTYRRFVSGQGLDGLAPDCDFLLPNGTSVEGELTRSPSEGYAECQLDRYWTPFAAGTSPAIPNALTLFAEGEDPPSLLTTLSFATFNQSARLCVGLHLEAPEIAWGERLVLQFGGPSLLDALAYVADLDVEGNLSRVARESFLCVLDFADGEELNATVTLQDRNATATGDRLLECATDPIFDSIKLKNARATLIAFPPPALTNARRRRLRNLLTVSPNGTTDRPLVLYSSTLGNANAGPRVSAPPSIPCLPTAQAGEQYTVAAVGPGASIIAPHVACRYHRAGGGQGNVTDGLASVIEANASALECVFPVPDSLNESTNYEFVYTRPDTNVESVFASGILSLCAPSAGPTPTLSPAPANSTGPVLQVGAVVGVVFGVVAGVLLLLGLIFLVIARRKRDEENKKKPEADDPEERKKKAMLLFEQQQKKAGEEGEEERKPEDVPPIDPAEIEVVGVPVPPPSGGELTDLHVPPRNYVAGDAVEVKRMTEEGGEETRVRGVVLGGGVDTGGDYRVCLVENGDIVTVPGERLTPTLKFGPGETVMYFDKYWRLAEVLECEARKGDKGEDVFVYRLDDVEQTEADFDRVEFEESRLRWPDYGIGDKVDYRYGREAPPHLVGGEDDTEWFPAIVTHCDKALVHLTTGVGVPFARMRPAAFAPGDYVEELGNDGEWRPATVISAVGTNLYELEGASGPSFQRNKRRVRWPRYQGSDVVQVRFVEGGVWFDATVVALENTAVVAMIDNTIDPKRFAFSNVRRPPRSGVVANAGGKDEGEAEEDDDTPEARRKKFKVQAPLDYKDMGFNQFEITVDKRKGLGLRLGLTKTQEIVVAQFLLIKSGHDWGPIEASQLVGLRDRLIAVNGTQIAQLSFADVSELIKRSPDKITFVFGRYGKERLDVSVV